MYPPHPRIMLIHDLHILFSLSGFMLSFTSCIWKICFLFLIIQVNLWVIWMSGDRNRLIHTAVAQGLARTTVCHWNGREEMCPFWRLLEAGWGQSYWAACRIGGHQQMMCLYCGTPCGTPEPIEKRPGQAWLLSNKGGSTALASVRSDPHPFCRS